MRQENFQYFLRFICRSLIVIGLSGLGLEKITPLIITTEGSMSLHCGLLYWQDCPDANFFNETVKSAAPEVIRQKYFCDQT